MRRLANEKRLLILPLLEDIVDWALFILAQLFSLSKLGRDVELQNTHIIFFESPHDVMQVSSLSAPLGLGSQLVDWYWIATSVPYRLLLIDLSPRTDEGLYNHRIHFLKIFYPWLTETLKFLGRWKHKNSILSTWFHYFPTNANFFFLQSCSKEFIRFLRECIAYLLKRNLQSKKRYHLAKNQNGVRFFFVKKVTWKQKRDVLASEISYNSQKSLLFPSLTICLDLEKLVLVPLLRTTTTRFWLLSTYKAAASKVSSWTNYQVTKWLAQIRYWTKSCLPKQKLWS